MTTDITTFDQRPSETEIYEVDYDALYLTRLGDTAAELLEVLADPGITVTTNPPVGAMTSGVIQVSVSGVTAGTTYQVITRVRSAAGRRREWEFKVLGVTGGLTQEGAIYTNIDGGTPFTVYESTPIDAGAP